MKSSYTLLASKRFLPLFITQFMGAFNDNAFKNALLFWYTYDYAIKNNLDPASMLSTAAIIFMLPFFLFSATAGQLADKFEKSTLTHKIKLIEILLMLATVLGFMKENIYLLLTLLFLMGAQSTFFSPIKYSLLPLHLEDDELLSGNGMIEAATFLSILLGTIFGGVVINLSANSVFIFCALITILAIIGYAASLFIPEAPSADSSIKINFNIAQETWKLISYSKGQGAIWSAIIANSWFWLVGVTFLTQFPVYTKDFMHGNEYIVTLFLTIFSVGIGIGSMLCNSLLKGKIALKLTPIGAIGMSVSIFILYFSSLNFNSHVNNYADLLSVFQFLKHGLDAWLICLSLLALAIFSGLYIVPLYALIQHTADPAHASRVIACNNIINALFMVLSGIISLILFELDFDCMDLFLFVGVLNTIAVYWLVKFARSEKKQSGLSH